MASSANNTFFYVWNTYHLLDWIVLTGMFIVAGVVTVAVKPHCRTFLWTDATISYPQHPDTFPNYSLLLMVLFAMLFYVVFVLFLVKPLQRLMGEPLQWYALGATAAAAGADSYTDVDAASPNTRRARVREMQTGRGPLYPWLRAHLWAVGLQFCILAVLKVYAGRLRPDYLERLRAAGYTEAMKNLPSPQTNPQFFCGLMDDNPALREGRLSFPSGHSSTSWSVFTIMCFFFVAYLRPFARQASFTRLVICLCPLIVPVMCAVSRTRDNKHHFADILAGSLIGMGCALLAFYGSFRQVGGAAGIYFGRTAGDVDYDQLRDSADANTSPVVAGSIGGQGSSSEFGAVQPREDSQLRKTASPTVRINADGSASMSEALPRGATPVTERKLNEDPAAVPWI